MLLFLDMYSCLVKACVSLVTTGKDEYKMTGEKIVGWGGIMVCQCPTGIYCPCSSLSGSRRQGKTVYLYFTFQQLGSSKCFTYFLVQLAIGNLKLIFRLFPNIELEVVLLALEQSPVVAST